MNLRVGDNTKLNTIKAQYKQLVGMKITELKPFQVHFIEDFILMEEFINNQEILNSENNENTNAFGMFANIILDKVIVEIEVSVGKQLNKHFNTYLHVHTDSPCITIGRWNKIEPTFCISDSNYRTNNILCCINLTLIKNLRVKIKNRYNCNYFLISFSYDGIDYDIQIKTDS